MITIEGFQHAFLNSNSQNFIQYQLKNQFPLFKLLRRNKLNNGHSQIFSSPEFVFYGKYLSIKNVYSPCSIPKPYIYIYKSVKVVNQHSY